MAVSISATMYCERPVSCNQAHTIRVGSSPYRGSRKGNKGKGNARLKPTRLLDLRAGVSHWQEVREGRTGLTGRDKVCDM